MRCGPLGVPGPQFDNQLFRSQWHMKSDKKNNCELLDKFWYVSQTIIWLWADLILNSQTWNKGKKSLSMSCLLRSFWWNHLQFTITQMWYYRPGARMKKNSVKWAKPLQDDWLLITNNTWKLSRARDYHSEGRENNSYVGTNCKHVKAQEFENNIHIVVE